MCYLFECLFSCATDMGRLRERGEICVTFVTFWETVGAKHLSPAMTNGRKMFRPYKNAECVIF